MKSFRIIGFFLCVTFILVSGCRSIDKDKPIVESSTEGIEEIITPDIEATENDVAISVLDKLDISNLDEWVHPVKNVFEDYSVYETIGKLEKVELYNDKTYPVFYVDFKISYNNFLKWSNKRVEDILSKILIANGGWSYEIRNFDESLKISVVGNPKNTDLFKYTIGEWNTISEFLLNVRDKEFNEYLEQLPLEEVVNYICCSADLNGDGVTEYLFKYTPAKNYRGIDYFLLNKTSTGKYKNVGLLVDDYIVGHVITGESILQLDSKSEQKYVVFDVLHDAALASGYFIYTYDGVTVSLMFVNFPGATAYGKRELADTNDDGVYEHIDYYDMEDLQQHILIRKKPFTGGNEVYSLKYDNIDRKFVYPKTPEQVVKCFIEASTLFLVRPVEIYNELNSMSVNPSILNMALKFKPNNNHYNGVDLDLDVLEETPDRVIIKATDLRDNEVSAFFTLVDNDGAWKIEDIEFVQPTLQNNVTNPIDANKPVTSKTIITNDQIPIDKHDFSELNGEEKATFNEISKLLENNIFYMTYSLNGELLFDFDKDNKMETLVYQQTRHINEDSQYTVFTLKLGCSRLEITGVNCGGYDDGVEFIGVCDIDKNDDSVEVIVTTGSLYRHTNIYEYKDEKLVPLVSLNRGISAVSGDGKVYFWGGSLKETFNEKFNVDYVLEYYDLNTQSFIDTDQIFGRQLAGFDGYIIFENMENAPFGPPVQVTLDSRGAIRRINDGEKVTILEKNQDRAKIQTEDGLIGWIGGFHMVWD